MNNALEMYYNLQKILDTTDVSDMLPEADHQMSLVEETYGNLLLSAAPYLIYLPKDYEECIRVCIIGADGHAIAHAIEKVYLHAEVSWVIHMMDVPADIHWDILILSEWMSERMLPDGTFGFREFHHLSGKIDQILLSLSLDHREMISLVNRCNRDGYLMSPVDSNGLCLIRRPYGGDRAGHTRNWKFKMVYVVCPPRLKTGGSELLHQLVYWINRLGGNASIAYEKDDEVTEEEALLCNPELAEYVVGYIAKYEEIEDRPDNCVVLPETRLLFLPDFQSASIFLWHLSVDNLLAVYGEDGQSLGRWMSLVKAYVKGHLVQSEYARDFLLRNGLLPSDISYLGDYVNQIYLDRYSSAIEREKEDIVLYNPSKGLEFVKGLMDIGEGIPWSPIQNMTTEEVWERMSRAKVYIDFGNHPGKDRIPREAALCGCIVITGRRGSAAFYEDVPIPERYRISEKEHSQEAIVRLIREALMRYKEWIDDFAGYREGILREKGQFASDVRNIFGGHSAE